MSRKYLITENEFESIRVEGRDLVATRDNGTPVNFGQVVPDISPEMQQLLDDTEAARDQAEVFAAGTVALQDSAIALVLGTDTSESAQVVDSTIEARIEDRVQSDSVARIVAVPVGAEIPDDLNNGDLVIRFVPEVEQMHTDFSEYTIGEPPADWSRAWTGEASMWSVETASGASGGKVLRFVGIAGGPVRRGFVWEAVEPAPYRRSMDALMKWRSNQPNTVPRLAFNVSGSAGAENATVAGVQHSGTIYSSVYDEGVLSNVTQVAVAPTLPGTWYWTRARIVGKTVLVKTWEDGTPEPEYQLDRTRPELNIGMRDKFGIFFGSSFTDLTVDVDFLSVGFNGHPASDEGLL